MNAYEIEGRTYQARNEYAAVKEAYKMATDWHLVEYLGRDAWVYNATFKSGKAVVVVSKMEVI